MRSAKEEVANELSYYDEPPVWHRGEYYCKELSERLHIPVYDKDDVEHGMRENAFESEADAIRELAKQPCIIIGRCASEFLKIRATSLIFTFARTKRIASIVS